MNVMPVTASSCHSLDDGRYSKPGRIKYEKKTADRRTALAKNSAAEGDLKKVYGLQANS